MNGFTKSEFTIWLYFNYDNDDDSTLYPYTLLSVIYNNMWYFKMIAQPFKELQIQRIHIWTERFFIFMIRFHHKDQELLVRDFRLRTCPKRMCYDCNDVYKRLSSVPRSYDFFVLPHKFLVYWEIVQQVSYNEKYRTN